LALSLASLATEGDFGRDTLQEVTTTLAEAVRESPPPKEREQPARPYVELAQLVRYEHLQATLDDPQFAAATFKLEPDDKAREEADFSLLDLKGKTWTLQSLRGKVVLVNFWATWCPPCRKEMPDLDALYRQLKGKGLRDPGDFGRSYRQSQPVRAASGLFGPEALALAYLISTRSVNLPGRLS
jgi:thiol-disulfide isomerase/thioredoxin